MREGHAPSSFQDVLSRRRTDFVGRSVELDRFVENLELGVDDPSRKFIFSLSGQAGVGKSTLLREMLRSTSQTGAVATLSDTEDDTIVEVIADVCRQLTLNGIDARRTTRKVDEYLTRRSALLADPKAPPGAASLILSAAIRVGVHMLKPAVGDSIEAIADASTPENVDAARLYLSRKLKTRSSFKLVLDPVSELTRLLVADLSEADDGTTRAFFFDTFERRARHFGPWLADLLRGQYGALPPNLVVTLSGQKELDASTWSYFEPVHEAFHLDIFSEQEAGLLLRKHGLHDTQVTEHILELTGRLPVLVRMLAQTKPVASSDISDPAETAVDRFLKWESDPVRREVTLKIALPRRLDAEVIDTVAPNTRALAWVRELAFVTSDGGRLLLHNVVRSSMLRLQRSRAPQEYRELHDRLEHYFTTKLEGILDKRGAEANECRLEVWYHRLCARAPEVSRAKLDHMTLRMLPLGDANIEGWLETLRQASRDLLYGYDQISSYLNELTKALAEGDEGIVSLLSAILDNPETPHSTMLVALKNRAYYLYFADRDVEAASDYAQLRELEPEDSFWWVRYSQCLVHTKRYQEALEALDGAVAEDREDVVRLLDHKGHVLNTVKRYEEAELLLGESLELETANETALAYRARSRRELGRLSDALADADASIAISPNYVYPRFQRAQIFEESGEMIRALEEYGVLCELAPDDGFYRRKLAECRQDLGFYREAIADYWKAASLPKGGHFSYYKIVEIERFTNDYADAQTSLLNVAKAVRTEGADNREWVELRLAEMDRLTGNPLRSANTLMQLTGLEGTEEGWRRYSTLMALEMARSPLADRARSDLSDFVVALESADFEHHSEHFNMALFYAALGFADKALSSFYSFMSCKRNDFVNLQALVLVTEGRIVLNDASLALETMAAQLGG